MYDTCVENGCKITTMRGDWVAKYDKDIGLNASYNTMYYENFGHDFMIMGEEVNENIKIVHFANFDNTIHEHSDEWIKDHWC